MEYKKVIKFKKDIDQLAELSWNENKTKKYIIGQLGKDYYWSKKTALVYKIGNGAPVFFRAELDALNTNSGPKHVCGHSAHLAALMGAFLHFKNNPLELKNTIYFVFQPSEESFPSGAEFISKNFSEIKNCKAGFAFHVFPKLKLGEISSTVFAAGDYFEIEIKGIAAHAKDKMSGKNCDALLVAGELIRMINTQKNKDWIINVGLMKGGEASNRIAGNAKLVGDTRRLIDDDFVAKKWLKKAVGKIARKYEKAKIKVNYMRGCPLLKNDEKLLAGVKKIISIKNETRTFGAEDFSKYPVPKIFLLVGTGKNDELHSEEFEAPDELVRKLFDSWLALGKNMDKIIK